MKKIFLLFILLGVSHLYGQKVDGSGNLTTNSQQYIKTKSTNGRLQGWFVQGNNSLTFNQAAFSNWMAGGVNSYSLNANMDYEFNLTRGRHIWDNRFILAYGVLRNEGEDYRKSNDVIDLSSSYGYEFAKHFYFAGAMNFKTQFTTGFDYNVVDSISGDYKKISNFMAPGYLSFGLGVDYKPNENLQVNFHPFTSRFTFVQDKDLQYAGSYGLKKDGDSFLYEFGAFVGARYKFNITDNVSYDNRLGIYSNYLDNPLNMDIAYQGILDLKVTRFISAQATINLFYDEDQIMKTQLKQTLGVGFAYKFDNLAKLKLKEENLPPFPTVEEAAKALEDAKLKADEASKNVESAQQVLDEAVQKANIQIEEQVEEIKVDLFDPNTREVAPSN
jgi:hypothetical protein